MRAILDRALIILLLAVGSVGGQAFAQTTPSAASSRVALVIGIGSYRSAPRPTAPNDAGLVAQTLAAAGFDVTGARDLDGEALRKVFREFLETASTVGPQGIAVVYFAGRAVQFDGDNYLVPVDAALRRDSDVPIETVRLADLTRALAALPLAAKVVVIDGAYADRNGAGLYANGLSLVDPEPGTLTAFNAAPGTVAPIIAGNYGTYARVLTRTMKQGGVPVEEVFDRVRVAVDTETRGAVVPWDASKLAQSFRFFERGPDAPAVESAQIPFASLRNRPLRDFTPEQAYDVALARDTLPAYQDYLTVFPDRPLARRVRILLAARREALFWREAVNRASAPAFWTYLRRYPKGPHASEAQRRLARLAAARAPSADFAPLAFDVPPPPEAEYRLIERRFRFDDPDLEPPPPPPVFLLPPQPPEIVVLPLPAPAAAPGFLPIPAPVPIPFVRSPGAPGTISPPRGFKGTYQQPQPSAATPANGGPLVRTPAGQPRPGQPIVAPRPAGAAPSPGQNGAPSRPGHGTTPSGPGTRPGQPATTPAQNGGPGAEPAIDRRSGKPHGPARPSGADASPSSSPVAPSQQPAPRAPGAVPEGGALEPSAVPAGGAPDRHGKRQHTLPGGPATIPAAPASGTNQPGGAAGPASGQGELRRRKNERNGAAPAMPGSEVQPGRPRPGEERRPGGGPPLLQPQGDRRGLRGQPPNAFEGQAPRSAPEPRQRPQPASAFPSGGPQGGPPPSQGAGSENRNRRPECGHPGQPPCRP